MRTFQVDLDQYYGPLDLLLHIVRRDEMDLAELPLARIIDQYFDFLHVISELQFDDVAEFLEIASLLIEMKAKQAVPVTELSGFNESSDDEPVSEISENLVEQLIQYKRIRDMASVLDEQSRCWQLRYRRAANDLPPRQADSGSQPIHSIEVWDLVSAFGRILREQQAAPTQSVQYDEAPIYTHMQRIHRQICDAQRIELTSLFEPHMHKSTLVAMFLATLELTRHYGLTTEQLEPCRPLYLVAGPSFVRELQIESSGD